MVAMPISTETHWWVVSVPTLRCEGDRKVKGRQFWVVEARCAGDAANQAQAELNSQAALRHRRGARIFPDELTVAASRHDWPFGLSASLLPRAEDLSH
ncbi:hypothetical protein [Streptacidiphilus neutrinimicus]|uniref:hypothetical protein n=1 Tax=Streptacidiphilus neutrinimicus TaxID=105420 RepID=UPI001377BA5C|nr:hypothetical protein [Streptacidiphilus neutrinimicus]